MLRLNINGEDLTIDGVADDTPLLWVLRDERKLVGTKFGCGIAQCGYCQSEQLMSATALLATNPDPTDAQIDSALSPKKLLHTKWTAVAPKNKEKHFLVTKVIEPVPLGSPVVSVEIEAVHSKRARIIGWRELTDAAHWRRGWV